LEEVRTWTTDKRKQFILLYLLWSFLGCLLQPFY
jgi:hypothetical protein